jgi:hypothetical protein
VHPKSVRVPGDRDHCGAEIIEALVHPLRGLNDPAPTVEIGVDFVTQNSTERVNTRKDDAAIMLSTQFARASPVSLERKLESI